MFDETIIVCIQLKCQKLAGLWNSSVLLAGVPFGAATKSKDLEGRFVTPELGEHMMGLSPKYMLKFQYHRLFLLRSSFIFHLRPTDWLVKSSCWKCDIATRMFPALAPR